MATHPTTGDDEDYSSNSSWNDSYIDLYNVHRLSPNTVAILTAIFAVCVALSCVGNFVVICVMTCGKKKNKPFNSLLLNLAISDWSLGLLCLPFLFAYTMMSPEWIFGEALCVIIPFAQKAVRTLVSLVILFGVCWLPLHIYNLFLITYNPEYLRTQQDATKISRASIYIWLIFADTVFNPIVYIFMSDKFRKDFGRFTCRTKRALGMQADGYTEANSNATSYTSDGERKRSGTGNYVNMRTL
ncbi:neuropeptide Y receptor type 1-like isoform X2 [Ptychodera flava]|uniref:neuropeptide Y receptor type 1-like isoform X2 n=1 Tax=Ptychodera flava TaxID=63121 RepID=UPI003969EB7D